MLKYVYVHAISLLHFVQTIFTVEECDATGVE